MLKELPKGPFHRTVPAATYLKAEYGIKVSPKTLAKRRSAGNGPRYLRDPHTKIVTYPEPWLDDYARELLQPASSTSEEDAA